MISLGLIDSLFPAICPACRQQAGPELCSSCCAELPTYSNPCPYCASERPHDAHSCSHCHDAGIRGLRYIQTIGSYSKGLEQLINDAKAGARPAALRALANLAAERAAVDDVQAVIPIPPNPGRREGQHLATACAAAIAKQHQLPLLKRMLVTTRPAAEQHRLTGGERQRAVQGLFACRQAVPFRKILLVDDIYTSGNTLIAAAKAIRLAQPSSIQMNAFCLARTAKRG